MKINLLYGKFNRARGQLISPKDFLSILNVKGWKVETIQGQKCLCKLNNGKTIKDEITDKVGQTTFLTAEQIAKEMKITLGLASGILEDLMIQGTVAVYDAA